MPKRRPVAALAAILALSALLTACGGGGGSQQQASTPAQQSSSAQQAQQVREITVVLKDFAFEPEDIVVKRGERIRLVLDNQGTVPHDWHVDALNLASPKVQPGQTARFEFTADQVGEFESKCVEPGHDVLGMVGKLVVED
ncbi:MAG: cupredoxin domain-containing protein [Firmicutes bacterium]|nr:cupredoxin domain-containing protein [Bacillota bacterium]